MNGQQKTTNADPAKTARGAWSLPQRCEYTLTLGGLQARVCSAALQMRSNTQSARRRWPENCTKFVLVLRACGLHLGQYTSKKAGMNCPIVITLHLACLRRPAGVASSAVIHCQAKVSLALSTTSRG